MRAGLNRENFPILERISIELRIADSGMREPHWHPETAELCCVVAGRAR